MTAGRRAFLLVLTAAALSSAGWVRQPSANTLPARLTDREFWQLVEEASEPDGYFRSDNLVSNEDTYQYVIPDLQKTVKPGGVYVGVGPDQNFTYIAAVRPRLAFIPDVRRGNLHTHLMYKALFELSADRADFVARLFSRARPADVAGSSNAEALFDAINMLPPSRERFEATRQAIMDLLRGTHGWPLSADDAAGIGYVFGQFFESGPFLAYASGRGGRMRYPTFQDLQMATDQGGVTRAYLATEDHFRFVKQLSGRNLIVPLVGNFGGPRTLRAIGAYVRARGATVTTFYTSNVEQYLFQDGLWRAFADNVASMPLDGTSTFIRSCFTSCSSPAGSRSVSLLDSMPGLLRDVAAGRITGYWDVLAHR
jgi:hypothetical protein